MGVSALMCCDVPGVNFGDMWKSSDGKDYADLMQSPRCRKMLEEHVGMKLAPVLGKAWNATDKVLECLETLIASLPHDHANDWSEEEKDRYSYLYAELGGEITDREYLLARVYHFAPQIS